MGPSRQPWDEDHRKVRFMEWLTTPPDARVPHQLQELAVELGVEDRTLRNWRKAPDFRKAWDEMAQEIVRSPERAQRVLDTLYASAIDKNNRNQVQAAKLYLEATDAIKPKPMQVTVKRTTELSDEELDELLAQGAAEARAERDGG